jgi:3-oxoacyl-[acyl-carrier-protein] synthase II
MSTREAVWITGVGTVNPVGNTFTHTAEALLAGRSGIRPVARLGLPDHFPRIGGLIEAIPAPPSWDVQEFARLDRMEQLLISCSVQALSSAHCLEESTRSVGLVLGLGAEWPMGWEMDSLRGGRRLQEPELDGEGLLGVVRSKLGLTGPAVNVAAACAGSNYALALARRWVADGWVDVCLAGAAELPVTPLAISGFANLRTLSRRNTEPAAASRPFDRGRDGMVLGEGGAMFVLERAADARLRGVQPLAELAGLGVSSDAAHLVIPSSDPTAGVAAVKAALAEAVVNPDEIDYVNAHATSTRVGDSVEALVLKEALGPAVASVPVSSTKSMTGHLLSGAAAVNAVACLIALECQAVPPTINLDDPDPACDLCHIPHEARPRPVRVALSNSFGFGGCNTSIVLRKAA